MQVTHAFGDCRVVIPADSTAHTTLSPLAPLRGEGPGVRGYRKEKDSNPQAKPIILGSSARIPYRLYRFSLGSLLRVSASPREPIAAVKPHQPRLRPSRLIDGRKAILISRSALAAVFVRRTLSCHAMHVTQSIRGLHSECASYRRDPFPPLGFPSDPSSASPRLRVKQFPGNPWSIPPLLGQRLACHRFSFFQKVFWRISYLTLASPP